MPIEYFQDHCFQLVLQILWCWLLDRYIFEISALCFLSAGSFAISNLLGSWQDR